MQTGARLPLDLASVADKFEGITVSFEGPRRKDNTETTTVRR